MPAYLHAIETVVPENRYLQETLRDLMKGQGFTERRTAPLISRIYGQSGIEARHSVIHEPGSGEASEFYDPETRTLRNASTQQRNDRYAHVARSMFSDAARKALVASGTFTPADVTHVITVSCTGFFAPGPDYFIVRDLGLNAGVERYHLGFMGCYAALPALRAARSFCEANPRAVVLVVCVELCSLHYQLREDPDSLIAGSVFADGGAAAVISSTRPDTPGAVTLDGFSTTLIPAGEEDMAWNIGDHGFEMKLSTYVPAIIEEHIEQALEPLTEQHGLTLQDVPAWAVHPGGRSILDKVQRCLHLTDEQMRPSRETLREYGNMSSATILFVLERLLRESPDAGRIAAIAFGPGLTVETALFGTEGSSS